jgi:hypothetical protein
MGAGATFLRQLSATHRCARRRTAAVFTLIAASIFADAPAFSCNVPLRAMQRIELMFGRNVRSGGSDAAWAGFVAREITPRFPDGLTVLEAAGQWRDPAAGRLVRERSKLVIIVTPTDASADGKVAAIVAAYKQRFRQKSVGVITTAVCAAF